MRLSGPSPGITGNRYHHLFAQALQAHLLAEQPNQAPDLQRQASEWYGQHGSAPDAMRLALAGKDFARAARLVEMAAPAMRKSRQEVMLLGWLKALPDELIRFRPVLSVAYAGALLTCGEREGVEARLQDAERQLGASVEIFSRSATAFEPPATMTNERFNLPPTPWCFCHNATTIIFGVMQFDFVERCGNHVADSN